MKSQLRVRPLTIFLLKKGTKEDDTIDEEVRAEVDAVPIQLDGKSIGTLYAKQTPAEPPGWLGLFSGAIEKAPKLESSSVSAAYITRAAGRLFAITFGHGRHLLRPGSWEERFGLRATLNSVDPKSLRAVDVSTLESNPFHGKRQASREATLGEFGINLDRDILRAVTGRPLDKRLGRQMTGIDSLSVRVRVDLDSLHSLLRRYLQKSDETTYREGFPWVDHVAEVRDPGLLPRLFSELLGILEGRAAGSAWAAIPEVINWVRFDGFRFGSPKVRRVYDDVTLGHLLEAVDGEPLSLDFLRHKRVYCFVEGSLEPVQQWTFLHCLTAEVPLDGALYLLNAGTSYRISTEFVSEIERELEDLKTASVKLPEWGDEYEDQYNERVANQSKGRIALMDQVMVSHPGMASPVEFCDLLTRDRRLIHVKRYGQSSVLSHLFMQGLVSAECFLSDIKFRRALNEKLPKSHILPDPNIRPVPSSFEIVFAVGSGEMGQLRLPFFSRVTLRNVARVLSQSFGYRVTLTKIRVNKFYVTDPAALS